MEAIDLIITILFLIAMSSTIYYQDLIRARTLAWRSTSDTTPPPLSPISVNFHFTRKCNFECGFCFHTEKDSHLESIVNMKRGLFMLKNAGMRKINFAGGEPLLYPSILSKLVEFCKVELRLESVSIVTNGSRLTERFLQKSAKHIDIIAVSCDSFKEDVNIKIGRGKGNHLAQVRKVAKLCTEHGVKFKLNTVVNRYNFDEDMNEGVRGLDPFRWKCFQVLIIEGENDSDKTIRNASHFAISDEEYQQFCDTHSHNRAFVAESNNVMKSSYLILDEYMRFLNKGTGGPTESILAVGVQKAMENVAWDTESFHERGGIYD